MLRKRILCLAAAVTVCLGLQAQPVRIQGREVFWDDYLTEECTAQKVLHSPEYKAPVITLDKAWEGDGCGYFNVLYDRLSATYYMYYTALEMFKPDGTFSRPEDIHACVLLSRDGIRWTRPRVGVVKYKGSWANNIIVGRENMPGLAGVDNFYVMLDTNPAQRRGTTPPRNTGQWKTRHVAALQCTPSMHRLYGHEKPSAAVQ